MTGKRFKKTKGWRFRPDRDERFAATLQQRLRAEKKASAIGKGIPADVKAVRRAAAKSRRIKAQKQALFDNTVDRSGWPAKPKRKAKLERPHHGAKERSRASRKAQRLAMRAGTGGMP